jgi:hypothetical protein
MKVALFYSEAAGDGVTLAELRATLTSGGHQLVSTVERHANPSACWMLRQSWWWQRGVMGR